MRQPAANQHYLEAAIRSAPPARLRLMLIERGVEIARSLAAEPDAASDPLARSGHRLRLRDILGELLAGIAAGALPIAVQVSDLYVFLLQHLTRAEQTDDRRLFAEIAGVLDIERQTWTEVCASLARDSANPAGRQPSRAPIASGRPATGRPASLNLQA